MNTNCKKQKDRQQIKLNKKDRKDKEFRNKDKMKNKNNRKEHEVSKNLQKIIWQLNIKMKKEFL